MPIVTYLTFDGNCREAFDFYRSVFGGEYEIMQTFADAPPDTGVSESEKDQIMHATLSIGDGVIMGSDSPSGFGPPPVAGNNFSLSYSTRSREETGRVVCQDIRRRQGNHATARYVLGRVLWFLHRQVWHQLDVELRYAAGLDTYPESSPGAALSDMSSLATAGGGSCWTGDMSLCACPYSWRICAIVLASLAAIVVVACAMTTQSAPTPTQLPDGPPPVRSGQEIFASICAACHGTQGQGQSDWHIPNPRRHDASSSTQRRWSHMAPLRRPLVPNRPAGRKDTGRPSSLAQLQERHARVRSTARPRRNHRGDYLRQELVEGQDQPRFVDSRISGEREHSRSVPRRLMIDGSPLPRRCGMMMWLLD